MIWVWFGDWLPAIALSHFFRQYLLWASLRQDEKEIIWRQMPLFGIRFMQYLNIFTIKKYFEAFSAALYHVKLWVSCHFLESWSHWYLKLQHLLVSQDESTRPSNRSYNGGRLTHTWSKSTFRFLAALCSSRTAFPQASKSDVSTVIWPTGVLTW